MTFEKSISFHLAAKGFWLLLCVAGFPSILIKPFKKQKGILIMVPCLPVILLLCIYGSFAKEILKHIIRNVNILPTFIMSVAKKAT